MGGRYALVVLLLAEEASATENAGRLEAVIETGASLRGRPWSELIGRREISTSGRLLLAKLWGDDLRLAVDALCLSDTLLIHE